ncbi:MAG TPA: nucleoside triphosphate pyrophosphohydrolase [candidate division Zixibacteria bacterium]
MEKRRGHQEYFKELVSLMAMLRGKNGCPWDRSQTHNTLLPYLIEETYEVVEAVQSKDYERLKEELGDLLLQIVFHSQIAKEKNRFDVYEVARQINLKLRQRHPHIFENKKKISKQEVIQNWEHIKLSQKKDKGVLSGLPRQLPGLLRAYRLQEKVGRLNFDWKNAADVLPKLKEELGEFEKAFKTKNKRKMEEEMGDILFSWVNLCRHLNINPELALGKTVDKFIRRFNYIEKALAKKRIGFDQADLPFLDSLWEKAKKRKNRK